jgi:hypothetical protein
MKFIAKVKLSIFLGPPSITVFLTGFMGVVHKAFGVMPDLISWFSSRVLRCSGASIKLAS